MSITMPRGAARVCSEQPNKSKRAIHFLGACPFSHLAWILLLVPWHTSEGQAPGPTKDAPLISIAASPSHPLAILSQKDVSGEFKVISGDPSAGHRVAVVVQDADEPSPGPPPSTYDSCLLFAITTTGDSPTQEAVRLRLALDRLAQSMLRIDLWAIGKAGLIVRYAVERAAPGAPPLETVILIDTPHRGLSASGWPLWQANDVSLARLPKYEVSGSSFLVELNRAPLADLGRVRYLNVWRELQQPSPRATAMNLPRRAVLVALRPRDDRLWSLFDSHIVAVRRIAEGGVADISETEAAVQDREVNRRAPRLQNLPAPSFASLLDDSRTELADISATWLVYKDDGSKSASSRGPPNPFARMTDAVSVGYDPRSRRLVIIGFEDFSRDPLHADSFFAALDSFKHAYPAISIDPPKVTDPPDQAPVRYVGSTKGTSLGGLMFEADRVMKTLALGQDNITHAVVASDVPGYRPIAGSGPSAEETASSESMWRLWFEPERWHAWEQSRFAAMIEARLRCRWERMTPAYAPSQAVVSFTDNLTTRFREYALEQPSLGQLDQESVLVAMARWTYDANLDVVQAARPPNVSLATPSRTPLIEVRNEGISGQYKVTQIIQGGVAFSPRLRNVRDEQSPAGRVMEAALLSIPMLQQGIAQHLAHPPPHTAKAPIVPPQLARPPTVSVGYDHNGHLYSVVAFQARPRNANLPIGSLNSSDKLTDVAYSANEENTPGLANSRPSIGTVLVDDSLDPPQLTLTGSQFGNGGLALFNGTALNTLKWTPGEVVVAFPPTGQPGTLVIRTADQDSNAMEFILVPGPARRDPPQITVTNRTSYALHVEIHAQRTGSSRVLDVLPGSTSTTRVLPGRYNVTAQASGELVVGATKTEEQTYERGYEYSLTYEQASFALGELIVNNNTGGVLTITVNGQVVSVAPGKRATVRLPFGNQRVHVDTRCGSEVTDQVISPGRVQELSYGCRRVFR